MLSQHVMRGSFAAIFTAWVLVIFVVVGQSWGQQTSQTTEAAPPAVAQPAATPATPQSSGAPATALANPAPSTPPPDLRIESGDLLDIKVFGAPDLSQEVRVSGGGEIDLQLVGPVPVKGLTTAEAEKTIESRLRKGGYVNDPHVTVFAKEFSSQGISVLGEVAKPGIYVLPGWRRLYDVISSAGGLTARAGRDVTITHRNDPEHPQKVEVTSDPARSLASNVQIMPGDTVVVSKAGVVYVLGDVPHAAGFVMEDSGRMSVLQAVALAGGPLPTASLNKARIIRRAADGTLQEIAMPLKPILAAKQRDAFLQANDILFIPSSASKRALHRTTEGIAQGATALAIYHP